MAVRLVDNSSLVGKTYLYQWLNNASRNCKTVVEFGAGFFNNLGQLNECVEKRIGIEIWQSYIDNALFSECFKIKGDFTKFEDYIDVNDMDCALFVDTLEHITRESAFELMARVKTKFNRILLMIPDGVYPLTEDVTGHGAHEYQTHRSTWLIDDVEALGFDVIAQHPNFHGHGKSCIFAIWNKKNV